MDAQYADRQVSGLFVGLAEPVLMTLVMYFAEELTTVQACKEIETSMIGWKMAADVQLSQPTYTAVFCVV